MNRREELRFQIYTSAKVALFDEPDCEIEAQIVDVSPSGLRLLMDTELLEDRIITIETDQHLILADVRNCKARGIRLAWEQSESIRRQNLRCRALHRTRSAIKHW